MEMKEIVGEIEADIRGLRHFAGREIVTAYRKSDTWLGNSPRCGCKLLLRPALSRKRIVTRSE
jgi:hypothetical protein